MRPYGVISDSHNHNWSAFSSVDSDGVNTRLKWILDETLRCAEAVKRAGGDTLFHAGDLFHVRGSVAPSVLNPTLAVYKKIVNSGIKVVINAGNHDLEGKEANELGSAITALQEVGCYVGNELLHHRLDDTNMVITIPWMPIEELKRQLSGIIHVGRTDVIIHAGIDGVIPGLPSHGLDRDYLQKLGFRRVLAGHYHNHKDLGDGVYSVGALTHQTWSDIGTKAGFLIVSDEGVKWHSTHAPSFIEIDERTDPDDIALLVDGNYVRAKVYTAKESEITKFRNMLMDAGAKGINIISQPPTGVTRVESTVKAGASMEVSVEEFIKSQDFNNKPQVSVACSEILAEVAES